MIFGRKKRQETDQVAEERPSDAAEAADSEDVAQDAAPSSVEHGNAEAMAKAEAKWLEWDEEFQREEGPFDIEEVDLDADDVKRLDLGSLVVTPFPGMNLQLSVNKEQVPQAIIVSDGDSAIEVALFGAPARTAYIPEVRREIIAASQGKNARTTIRRGPFGTEIARAFPVQTKEGGVGMQISRTWLAEGPSWVLRGVVFGKAALEPQNEDATITLTEFFANLVVRRGTAPVAPGAVIPFTIPEPEPKQES
ncbi:DUF3710 domain-containing protein [Tessaracoccus oleiagri]|uniref:DUF3710 domain-containing protein n=1 Tax=Tessaracoccus oleiagri TaxID=686624 RepID=A0A1G9MKX1_9ACTN|nr:DUF3710 domain-containing protein [Tessaracoccus oleiagri]SDL74723.1 Protein of unknown function [Tessaracoccus oleiagri]